MASSLTVTYASTTTVTVAGDQTQIFMPGTRIQFTQGTIKYALVVLSSYSPPTTTLTLYLGTDYTLANSAMTNLFYAPSGTLPYGWPTDPGKWTVELADTGNQIQAGPVSGTWYNPGGLTITIPTGIWDVSWNAFLYTTYATLPPGRIDVFATLSTTNNGESDFDLTGGMAGQEVLFGANLTRSKVLNLTSPTVYYLNLKTNGTGYSGSADVRFFGDNAKTFIRARSRYV